MTPKNYVTLILQAFATGALGWLSTHATATPAAQWEALGFGLVLGGLGGLFHLFQSKPGGADAAAEKMAKGTAQ